MPRLTVIIATKNGSRYITKALASIFDQTFAQHSETKDLLEVLVINDGSTDSTVQTVTDYALSESRLRLISLETNVGPGLARDTGIQEATGEYIAFIDDDDEWVDEDKLKIQYDFLNEHTDHILVGSSTIEIVNEQRSLIRLHKNPLSDSAIRSAILRKNCFAASSVLFKKESYLQVGGFKPMYLDEDYDLWLRMGKIGKFANVDGATIRYMVRPSNASSTNALEMSKITLRLVKEYRHDYPYFFIGLLKSYARILFLYVKNLF